MDDKIVLVGGGGHCKACIDVLETCGLLISGILDRETNGTGSSILGYPVLGNDERIRGLILNHSFLITVGQIKSALIRVRLFEKLVAQNAKIATVTSRTAHVSRHALLGCGTITMHHAIVNAGAKVGANCIINNKALIEHDSVINDHTHISTAAVINGNCTIGKRVFIGSNSVIAQGISIADDVIVGAGSVVTRDLTKAGIYIGNPARIK